jgi:hypothetical protein
MTNLLTEPTTYLARPEGRVGYDVSGNGPLVVLVPGMAITRLPLNHTCLTMVTVG